MCAAQRVRRSASEASGSTPPPATTRPGCDRQQDREDHEQLAAGEESKIKVRVKHKKQLAKIDEKNLGKPKVKIEFAATDEFGQTATEVVKLKLLVGGGGVIVVHHDAL